MSKPIELFGVNIARPTKKLQILFEGRGRLEETDAQRWLDFVMFELKLYHPTEFAIIKMLTAWNKIALEDKVEFEIVKQVETLVDLMNKSLQGRIEKWPIQETIAK